MSNPDTKRQKMAQALRSAFHAEAMEESPSNEEISQILVENGEDPDTVARQYQDLIAERIRAAKKERMLGFRRQGANFQAVGLRGAGPAKSPLPGIDVMRSRIAALSSKPEFEKSKLAVAYRNGTSQSDSDIGSLYQDLIDLGIIKDELES